MSAKFYEIPSLPFQDIENQNVADGQTNGRTDGRTDNVKTVYPPQTQFAGGITNNWLRALNDDYCVNV